MLQNNSNEWKLTTSRTEIRSKRDELPVYSTPIRPSGLPGDLEATSILVFKLFQFVFSSNKIYRAWLSLPSISTFSARVQVACLQGSRATFDRVSRPIRICITGCLMLRGQPKAPFLGVTRMGYTNKLISIMNITIHKLRRICASKLVME